VSTGDGLGHHYGRNGEFCITVTEYALLSGLLTYWPNRLKVLAVKGAGRLAHVGRMLAFKMGYILAG